MAFVNRRQDAVSNEAGSGELVDFDPSDPDVVKVHYDLSTWGFEQRAEISERLAESEVPHAWDGDELVVPEAAEDAADDLFNEVEAEFGPFPVSLGDDEESTEFGLDEWSDADRAVLTEALVEGEIPHRWEGTTVVVAADAEDDVDDLLDAIEAGELLPGVVDEGVEPPDGVLSTIFLASDKLVRDPFDAGSRRTLLELDEVLDAQRPPYAFAPRTWGRAVAMVSELCEHFTPAADDELVDLDDEDDEGVAAMTEIAQTLRGLLRPFV